MKKKTKKNKKKLKVLRVRKGRKMGKLTCNHLLINDTVTTTSQCRIRRGIGQKKRI
jgi:hypothetical protein